MTPRVAAILLLLAAPAWAAEKPPPGWAQGAQLFFNEAERAFREPATRADAAGREARFGRAVMLLGVQPKTGANLAESRALFSALRTEKSDDETGIAALYYLARLAQLHEAKPNLAEARARFRELAQKHAAHFFGQLAGLKLAVLALYDSDSAASPAARLAEAEAWGKGITIPSIAGDFHWLMAEGILRFSTDHAPAIEHLLVMERIGSAVRDQTRSNLFVTLGELARVSGRRELAARSYRQFLEAFPRDARSGTIRRRLAEVEGGKS